MAHSLHALWFKVAGFLTKDTACGPFPERQDPSFHSSPYPISCSTLSKLHIKLNSFSFRGLCDKKGVAPKAIANH